MLDAVDQTLLRELDKNARVSLTQLAKRTRISKEKAHYRLKRLEQSIITGYWAMQRSGNRVSGYKLFLKDKSLGARRADLVAFLSPLPSIAWIAQTEGRWDFIIANYGSNDTEFVLLMQELLRRFGTQVGEKAITKMTGMITLNEKYLHTDPYVRVGYEDFTKTVPTPDNTDQAILNRVAHNARASFKDISEGVGLTPEAVSYRFRQLLKRDAFVDFKLRIDHAALGLSYYHIQLSIADYSSIDGIISYYKQHQNCVYIGTHIGAYDIHLEVVVPEKDLHSFVADLSERFGRSLAAYEVLRIIKEHKMTIQQ